jgi:hypothetical protein
MLERSAGVAGAPLAGALADCACGLGISIARIRPPGAGLEPALGWVPSMLNMSVVLL